MTSEENTQLVVLCWWYFYNMGIWRLRTNYLKMKENTSELVVTHSSMFYSRQLSCYNLDVHLSDTESAHMCLWEETLTGRGGNEIASCLFKVLSLENFPKRNKLIVWSDNCIGQNKNKIMLMLFIYLVASGMYDQIE